MFTLLNRLFVSGGMVAFTLSSIFSFNNSCIWGYSPIFEFLIRFEVDYFRFCVFVNTLSDF